MIEASVQRTRRAFFSSAASLPAGDLSPISISSLVECNVYPVVLYGIENRMLYQKLQKFQGEMAKMAKRNLKLPKEFSNTAAKIALGWHSMHSICTIRKLKYLSRITGSEYAISHHAFCSLVDDIESLCLDLNSSCFNHLLCLHYLF